MKNFLLASLMLMFSQLLALPTGAQGQGDVCPGCAANPVALGGTTLTYRNVANPLDVAGTATITSDVQVTSGKCSFQVSDLFPNLFVCVRDPNEGACGISVTFDVGLDGDTFGTTEVWRASAAGTVCNNGFSAPSGVDGLNDTTWTPTVPASAAICGLGCKLEPTLTIALFLLGLFADELVATKSWSPTVTFVCTGCTPIGVPGGN